MPCDSIQTSTLVWSAQTDPALLRKALEAEGFQVRDHGDRIFFDKHYVQGTFFKATGQMVHTGRYSEEMDEASLKRAYSKEVVESQARKFGWKIQWKTNGAGQPEATVQRRG